MDDWRTLSRRYGYIARRVAKDKDAQKLLDDLIGGDDGSVPNNALLWTG